MLSHLFAYQSVCLLVLASSSASPCLKLLFKLRKPMTRPFESLRKDKEEKSREKTWKHRAVVDGIRRRLFTLQRLCVCRSRLSNCVRRIRIPFLDMSEHCDSLSNLRCQLNIFLITQQKKKHIQSRILYVISTPTSSTMMMMPIYIYTICVETRYRKQHQSSYHCTHIEIAGDKSA